MKLLCISFILLLLVGSTAAQNCSYYYFQNNKTVTMGIFNKKGSSDGKVVYTISNVNSVGATTTAQVVSEIFDKKNKTLGKGSGAMECKGGELMIDMRMMLPPQTSSQIKSASVAGKGSFIQYPTSIKVGQTLADGFFSMNMKMEGDIPATVSMDITNRKVEARETVTTPGGTWEAYKITYQTKTVIDMGIAIPVRMEMTEWFVPGFGVVKSASKMGTMELLSIQ